MTSQDDSERARRALEDVLARAGDVGQSDIRAKLQWLEDAANAADALERTDDDEDARDGVLHLRAALGAVVKWTQTPGPDGKAPDASPESVAKLEMMMRTLIARGLVGLYRSLASAYDELAHERGAGVHRAACGEIRDAFRDAARAIERGEEVPAKTREKLEKARASLG